MGIKCSKHAKTKTSKNGKSVTSKAKKRRASKCFGSSDKNDEQITSKPGPGPDDDIDQNNENEQAIYENTQEANYDYIQENNKYASNSEEVVSHLYVNGPQTELKSKKNSTKDYKNTEQSHDNIEKIDDYVTHIYENKQPENKYGTLNDDTVSRIYDSAQLPHIYNSEQPTEATRGKRSPFTGRKLKSTFSSSFFKCGSSDNNFEKKQSRLDNIQDQQGARESIGHRPAPPLPDAIE